MDWLKWVVFSTLLYGIQGVSLNPFAAFADHQYEPAAEYSIQRGVYLTNMPTASIFPLMSEENLNGMVGIPSLQSPFVNPLLPQQPSLFTVAKQNVRSKAKNIRLNQPTSVDIRDQGQQNLHGVTLDLRGGGYRLEQPRSQRPYKPPGSGVSPPRNNGQRPNSMRNTASSVNRKQIQRPRNPPQKPPHYNMKLGSIPPNAEFVNPENVLPLHPRIYKQFLQQNPQAAAMLRAQKHSSPNSGSFSSSNSFDSTKQIPPKITRNRNEIRPNNLRNNNIRPNSQLSSLSSFSKAPTNFQLPETQQLGSQLNYGLQGQSSLNQGRQPTFEDFYNSDPQFYAQLSQTPEGKAMLSEMMKHFPSSGNKPVANVANKVPTNIVPKSNPFAQTYADINSYHAAAGLATGNNLPTGQNQYGNNYGLSGPTNTLLNKQNVPNYSLQSQYNQRPQQPIPPQQMRQQIPQQVQQHVSQHIPQQQPPIQHQATLQSHLQNQPQQSQQPQISSNPSSSQLASYSGRQPYDETIPSPGPPPEPKKPYAPPQAVNHQYNSYSEAGYSDDSSSSFPSSGIGYDPSTYQSPYQENPKVVDGSTIDHAGYATNFSPVDPLASVENADVPASSYYKYPSREAPSHSESSSYQRYPSTALHEISPSEIVKRPAESSNSYRPVESSNSFRQSESSSSFKPAGSSNSFRPSESSSSYRPQTVQPVNAPGYWTPEQLFAPQSTGLQNESPFSYASAISSTSQQHTQDEQQDGSERAALHLPEEAPSWSAAKPEESSAAEYSEASELDTTEEKDTPPSTEQPENNLDGDSDETYKATMRDLQKLWTRVPPRSTSVATRATTLIYRSTEPPPLLKPTRDELKNHRTTPSYTFQYSPTDKSNAKSTAAWWSRKPDGTRYKIPPPQPNTTSTTSTTPSTTSTTSTTPSTTSTTTTTTTTTMSTTSTTESEEPTHHFFTTTPATTSIATTTPPSNYQDSYQDNYQDDTPLCAKHNNLTYCLQDPEYPKEAIREAIERNRHPLDHFLVDISAASNVVDDHSLHSVFENSAPLQSTSISYSFEGKVISPNAGEMLNTTGCNANVYYAKPLRALNTAGLWKVIVNVEFEDTGANYTQTVRIEECTHPPGYVATCGVHSISACLQQYKLYRLLSWEAHRGFYIDAFLLPVSCFCGSQE